MTWMTTSVTGHLVHFCVHQTASSSSKRKNNNQYHVAPVSFWHKMRCCSAQLSCLVVVAVVISYYLKSKLLSHVATWWHKTSKTMMAAFSVLVNSKMPINFLISEHFYLSSLNAPCMGCFFDVQPIWFSSSYKKWANWQWLNFIIKK